MTFFRALREAAEDRAINHAVAATTAASILEEEGRGELEIDREEQVRLDIDTEREMEVEKASWEFEAEVAWDAAHTWATATRNF